MDNKPVKSFYDTPWEERVQQHIDKNKSLGLQTEHLETMAVGQAYKERGEQMKLRHRVIGNVGA
jgi:hypothetical protein